MGVEIKEVSDDVYQIDPYVCNSKGYISMYLLTGTKNLLFDVGPSSTAQGVIDALEAMGYSADKIHYVFVSHVHTEHAGGLAKIASWAANAKIIVSPAGLRHLTDPSKMYQSFIGFYGRIGERIGEHPPIPQEALPRVLSNLSEIQLGEKRGRILQCVGHAHHQICLQIDGSLFGADILNTQLRIGDQLIPTSVPPSFNYSKYTEDLDTALTLNLDRLMVSHYGVFDNPTDIITKALDSLKWLRRQVETLLKEGLLAEEVADTLIKNLNCTPQLDAEYARAKAWVSLMGFINSVIKIRSERT